MVPKICAVDDCGTGGYLSRGWCQMHYARWKRHGETGSAKKQHAVSWAGATCVQDGCTSGVKSRGYCLPHYKRFRRWGDASIKRPTTPVEVRFWSRVDKREPAECWPWTAGTTAQGYGGLHPKKGETVLAHRFAYELEFGSIPAGAVIDHACHNGTDCPPGPCEHRLCCNPRHLEPTSIADNINRSHNSNIKKTHCPRGHAYTASNTRTHVKANTTGRSCLECARGRDNRRAAEKRLRNEQQKAA